MTKGINLTGPIRAENGLAEACRMTARALDCTDIPFTIYDWSYGIVTDNRDTSWEDRIGDDLPFDISVMHINAQQLITEKRRLPERLKDTYRIGVWYWELPEFPKEWYPAFDMVDELWAPTGFVREMFERSAPCPVIYMPPGIKRDDGPPVYGREHFMLPWDRFLFLLMYDYCSISSRKNPEAAIRSFQKAFGPGDDSVGLVIKVSNMAPGDAAYRSLARMAGEYRNIYMLAEKYSRQEINDLIRSCDAAVSLHRAEGLGLLCEEAMYYGKPVIATGWSGNTDFMNEDNSCLVDYKLVPTGPYYGLKDVSRQVWAEAETDQASEYMKRLARDRDYAAGIGRRGKEQIRNNFSPRRMGERISERIEQIV